MAKINIFSQPILINYLISNSLDEEIIKVLKEEEQKNYSVNRSNKGGFQTKPIDNKLICEKILSKSMQMIIENLKLKQATNFQLCNLWINKNKKNDYNIPHIHPRGNFSGVYYCQSEGEGNLTFINNDTSLQTGNDDFFHDDEFSYLHSINPEKNKIILFPSGLMHMAESHNKEEDRISVAFNIVLHHG